MCVCVGGVFCFSLSGMQGLTGGFVCDVGDICLLLQWVPQLTCLLGLCAFYVATFLPGGSD